MCLEDEKTVDSECNSQITIKNNNKSLLELRPLQVNLWFYEIRRKTSEGNAYVRYMGPSRSKMDPKESTCRFQTWMTANWSIISNNCWKNKLFMDTYTSSMSNAFLAFGKTSTTRRFAFKIILHRFRRFSWLSSFLLNSGIMQMQLKTIPKFYKQTNF